MADTSLGTAEQLRDPNYTPPLAKAVPLGIQHVLAMFVSNVTPAIIVAGAAGIGFGSDQGALGFPDMTYMIQMSMLFAGIATLFQTIGMGPVGARLPIVQGTSFAFVPVMIPAVAGLGTAGLAGLMTGVMIGGVFHFCLGFFVGRIRYALPPLVTGLIVLMIGLALVKVGVQYAAGGVPLMGKPEFGSLAMWIPALVVIVVTLAIKFFTRGFAAVAAVLIGIIAGYIVALMMGQVNFASLARASYFAPPIPFKWGFEFNFAIVLGMCFMAIVSAIETVGDTSGITKGGAGREATDKEIEGATFADGLGTAVRRCLRRPAQHLILAECRAGRDDRRDEPSRCDHRRDLPDRRGLHPEGRCDHQHRADQRARRRCHRDVRHGLRRRRQHAVGCQVEPPQHGDLRHRAVDQPRAAAGAGSLQHLGKTAQILLTSGLLPAALIAIVLNLALPEDLDD